MAGLVLGLAAATWWGDRVRDEALARQQDELVRLRQELQVQKDAVAQQAHDLEARTRAALGQADALLAAEGTAAQKLKAVIATLKALRATLSPN